MRSPSNHAYITPVHEQGDGHMPTLIPRPPEPWRHLPRRARTAKHCDAAGHSNSDSSEFMALTAKCDDSKANRGLSGMYAHNRRTRSSASAVSNVASASRVETSCLWRCARALTRLSPAVPGPAQPWYYLQSFQVRSRCSRRRAKTARPTSPAASNDDVDRALICSRTQQAGVIHRQGTALSR